MKFLGFFLWFLGLGASSAFALPSDYRDAGDSSYFNTPLRVLLDKSPTSVSLRTKSPATVRVNEQINAPKLKPGLLVLLLADRNRVKMIRIPFRPLVFNSIELLWPVETSGFEYGGKEYRGRIRVVARNAELYFIDVLPLETYLAGTVGGEMNASWSLEALKAQAVAARSYALYRREHPRNALYDIDSSTEDQVYPGVQGETPKTWAAVRATRGIYLAQGGTVLKAHYHSRCGGTTQRAEQVWKGKNSVGPKVACPFCIRFPFRWTAKWSIADFLKKIGLPLSGPFRLEPTGANDGTRTLTVQAGNQRTTFSVDALRRSLGYGVLKSGNFQMEANNKEVLVEGLGAGHGVGMCQWGAKYLAEKGKSFDAILAHYYPGKRLAGWKPELQKSIDPPSPGSVWSAHDRSSRFRFSASSGADSQAPDLAER